MLNTIKAKIIFLTISISLALAVIMTGVAFVTYKANKTAILKGHEFEIAIFAEQANQAIAILENNAISLASFTQIYYKNGKDDRFLNDIAINIFDNYKDSLGGGVWFRPFIFGSKQRFKTARVLYDKNDRPFIDKSVDDVSYNYPMQHWYLEIMAQLQSGLKVAWSTPYFEPYDSDSIVITVGVGIYDGKELVGVATIDWGIGYLIEAMSTIKPTPGSFALFVDKDQDTIISSSEYSLLARKLLGSSLSTKSWYSKGLKNKSEFTFNGKKYIFIIKHLNNGASLIVNIPKDELFLNSFTYLIISLALLFVASGLIAVGVYIILRRNINQPIAQLIQAVKKIGSGHLDVVIDLKKPKELANLAASFNKMAINLKENLLKVTSLSKAKEKIEAELSLARSIQKDALIQKFPTHTAFEVTASMTPAKEVGGDFYDVFFVDQTHLALVIADVSGKGVTAALFMMSAKTMIRNILQNDLSVSEKVDKINNDLCENNLHNMFTTAFIGILDINTGELQYVNAGHCPPLVKSATGYHYLEPIPNLPLGVMGNYKYQPDKYILKADERFFLYTDGVTEAQGNNNALYGPEQLKQTLERGNTSITDDLVRIKENIFLFSQGKEQFDDITMLELLYFGPQKNDQKIKT